MGEIAIKHTRLSASGCPNYEKLYAENAGRLHREHTTVKMLEQAAQALSKSKRKRND
jgi:hypothetical protein